MLTLSLIACGSNILGLYKKLINNPISVSMSDQLYSIENVSLLGIIEIHFRHFLPV